MMNVENNFEFKEISCPVCEQDNAKFLGWRGGEAHHDGKGVKTAIVRCRNCSHQYPNPMPFPVINLDEVYINADEYFRGQNVEIKKQIGLRLISRFEEKTDGRKFLDVGCGIGELLWAAKQRGWEAEGIDPSKEFIEIGREKLGVEGQVMTLAEANYPDNYFDAAVLSGIIEHLYNPLETLREINRVLKPGGWLWLDAPNEDGLYMLFGNLYMKLRRKSWVVVMAPTFPPYHVQGFNPKSIGKIVKSSGFRLDSLEIVGEVCEQTGQLTIRKKFENKLAGSINKIGKMLNRGLYMSVWTQKKSV